MRNLAAVMLIPFIVVVAAVVVSTLAVGVAALGSSPSPRSVPNAAAASASAASALGDGSSWRLRTAVMTLQGIRGRDGSTREQRDGGGDGGGVGLGIGSSSRRLDLLHDFHDRETGLCSEGVWHNSMLGIALVKASQRIREEKKARSGGDTERTDALAKEYREWARRLATNLFELNFDPGRGFRRRSSSGIWDRIDRSVDAKNEGGEFYRPSEERRCISNAAAVIFMTYLKEAYPDDGDVSSMTDDCGDAFLAEFFDKRRGRFRYETTGDAADADASADELLWRSSDQALGIMACLRLLRAWKERVGAGAAPRRKLFETRTMAASAAERLLEDFGFGAYATEGLVSPVNTIGDDVTGIQPGDRNSWHDSLACFAILASNATSGRESPIGLCRFMARDYGIVSNDDDDDDDGSGDEMRRLLLAHDVQENRFRDGPNAYTCTQAIWDACRRAVGVDITGFEDFMLGLQSFHEKSSVRENDGALSTVGTTYPMVRLWANTELAAWLLIDSKDFTIEQI